MILTKTPFRVSFFGGGTDYPVWFREHGGAVLATAIGYYCYIHGRFLPPFFDHKHRISWSKIELPSEIDDIEHPAVREALRWTGLQRGMEVHHLADLPARSGLGSSSAFAVGLLLMLHTLKGEAATAEQLAQEAIYLEQTLLKESVGVQDQITAACGGFNKIEIHPDGTFAVNPVTMSDDRFAALQERFLLYYTGVSRFASQIAEEKIAAIPSKHRDLHEMRRLVDVAEAILSNGGDLDDFGRLMHETWLLKRGLLSRISPDFVDEAYQRAREAGALGGKLLGAGGGGFLLFYVQPERRAAVEAALDGMLSVPFEYDFEGAKVVYSDRDIRSRMPSGAPRIGW